MTLVTLWADWTNQDQPRLICQTDSRVSKSSNRKTITDHSTKLFCIPVQVCLLKDFDVTTGLPGKSIFSSAIGFAYAGDCVLAQNIVNLLFQTLGNLVPNRDDRDPPAPSWEELRAHISLIVQHVAKEYNGICPMRSDLVTFGMCPSNNTLQVDHFIIQRVGGVDIKSIDILNNHLAFGSGKANFLRELGDVSPVRQDLSMLTNLKSAESDHFKQDKLDVEIALTRQKYSERFKAAFDKVIANGPVDVGGHIQMAEVINGKIAMRKRTSGDLFGIPQVESIGDFNVMIVIEPSFSAGNE